MPDDQKPNQADAEMNVEEGDPKSKIKKLGTGQDIDTAKLWEQMEAASRPGNCSGPERGACGLPR